MTNNAHTITIDTTVLRDEQVQAHPVLDSNDRFSRWIVKPLMLLAAAGLMITGLFASAFVLMLSVALLPLMALAGWALKKKVERDMARANPVVAEQNADVSSDTASEDVQGAR